MRENSPIYTLYHEKKNDGLKLGVRERRKKSVGKINKSIGGSGAPQFASVIAKMSKSFCARPPLEYNIMVKTF